MVGFLDFASIHTEATEDMDSESFKAALKTRPLVLRPGKGPKGRIGRDSRTGAGSGRFLVAQNGSDRWTFVVVGIKGLKKAKRKNTPAVSGANC